LGKGVLCHHSPGQISLAFGQDPLHLDGDHFLDMQHCFLQTMGIMTSILVIAPSIHLLLPADICFHLSQATHESHHWLIHNTIIYHICTSKGSSLILWFLSFWRQGVECGGK